MAKLTPEGEGIVVAIQNISAILSSSQKTFKQTISTSTSTATTTDPPSIQSKCFSKLQHTCISSSSNLYAVVP